MNLNPDAELHLIYRFGWMKKTPIYYGIEMESELLLGVAFLFSSGY